MATPPLSGAEVRRFREDGVLALTGRCGGAELRDLRRVLMRLFDERAGQAVGHQFDMLSPDREGHDPIQSQLLNPSLYAPGLRFEPHFLRMQALARQLLGADAKFSFDHAILTRQGSTAATPWHQDEAHHRDPRFQFEQVSFWMPLQDVTEHDGCMRYLPGSHLGPLLPHRPLNGDSRIHALECLVTGFDASAALALPVNAGSCILHAGRTLHAGVPSRVGAERLVYVIVFRSAPRPRTDATTFAWLDEQRAADPQRWRTWRRPVAIVQLWWRRLRRMGAQVEASRRCRRSIAPR